MKKTIHRSENRGHVNHGWLKATHSFSFARYYNPEMMGFGLLRVLNDDIIEAGTGFGTHPHDNMEIVTVPITGALEHMDSTGHKEVIRANDVQIMSAGSGLTHSEYNHSKTEIANILQLWIMPKEQDIEPRYDQKTLDGKAIKNKVLMVVSPERTDGTMWINQDAYISLSELDAQNAIVYEMKKKGNGVYVFLVEGKLTVAEEILNKRDAIGVEGVDTFAVIAEENSRILFVEVPME